MAQLFIDGSWRAAAEGGTREIRCPATGELVAEVDEATAVDTAAAIAAARRAFDTSGWATGSVHDRTALLNAVADSLLHHKSEVARAESLDTGKRLVESEYDVDDVVGRVPLLRPDRRRGCRPGGRHRAARRPEPGRPRADRGVRPHHPLELPVAANLLEGRAGARRREHLRPQAERADPLDRDPAAALPRRGGYASRRGQPRSRSAARPRAHRWPPTPMSISSRSPAACRPAGT